MHLKLEKLQKIVKNAIKDEKRGDLLKEEITRVVGPVVVTTVDLRLMAETANKHLDVLMKSGKRINPAKTSVLLKFIDSSEPEVRRLVARLLPESFVKRMMFDTSRSVRLAVAERLTSGLVFEMVKKWPNDDQLTSTYKQKKLHEQGLPSPKLNDEEFDINGEEPLGDTAMYDDHPGMTDVWYDSLARKLVNQCGSTIESNWEEKLVDTYVNGHKSQGYEIDSQKLLDAVYDHLSSRDKKSLEENTLQKIVASLREEELMNMDVMPIINESIDTVDSLIKSNVSPAEYIQKFESVFSVAKTAVPNIGKKQGINENFARVIVPSNAMLPVGSFRSIDEKAIDLYVGNWNRQRQLRNQPYRLSWSPNGKNKISFHLGLS
jgi:hypothetical protein